LANTKGKRGRKVGRNCKHGKNELQFIKTVANLARKGKTNKKKRK